MNFVRFLFRYKAFLIFFVITWCLFYLSNNLNQTIVNYKEKVNKNSLQFKTNIEFNNYTLIFKYLEEKNLISRLFNTFEFIKLNSFNFTMVTPKSLNMIIQKVIISRLSNKEFAIILNLLFKNSAFLLDVEILKNMNLLQGTKNGVKKLDKITEYFKNNSNVFLHFGVSISSFYNLNKVRSLLFSLLIS